jgi:hypothetical protein
MSEMLMTEVTLGDKVRVQFHPPNPMRSFCEGVVRRVDVPTPEGRVFVVEVTHEVILDREHRIRPGFQDFIRYECQNDFPGRIEILPTAEQEVQGEDRDSAPDPILGEPSEEPRHEVAEQTPLEPEGHPEPEVEPASEAEADPAPSQVEVERQEPRRHGGFIGKLFGRQS